MNVNLFPHEIQMLTVTANLYFREAAAVTIAKRKIEHSRGPGERPEETNTHVIASEVSRGYVAPPIKTYTIHCVTCGAKVVVTRAEVDEEIDKLPASLDTLVLLRDAISRALGVK